MSDNEPGPDTQAEMEELEQVYDTDYEVGQDNVMAMGMDIHHPVFAISSTLVILFVVLSLVFPEISMSWLQATLGWIQNVFDWLFLSAGNIFVVFCLAMIILPFGKIRLGGKGARPDFSYPSWFAMLFAAGMGIGLMFWGVAEPVGYFLSEGASSPLGVGPGDARASLGAVMYHWGFHPWAIYGVVALSLAFFAYNKGLPLTMRSVFYPLLGDRVWGWFGHIIDILAVLATLFGLATSLGMGAQQAAAGLYYVFGIEVGLMSQIGIIIGVTAVATVSVVRGIDGGVKLLSNLNMILATLLLIFVMFAGGILAFTTNLGTTVAGYLGNILPLSNPVGREDTGFYHGWTVFFWAWWISWSPFVGMFIARVSRGRTVREFMTAVLIIPLIVTTIWMTAFGGAGIDQVAAGVGELADGVGQSELALFQMLHELPLASISSILGVLLVLVFFITSSDSGSLVIDSITAGGKTDSPVSQRVFWAVIEGVVAGVLLAVGGSAALAALQAGAVSTALPFVFVLLALCISLLKGLNHELTLIKRGMA